MKWLGNLYSIVFAVTVIYLMAILEPKYFPVVRNWTVTHMEKDDHAVLISGYMHKVRACKFQGVVATDTATNMQLPLKFLDNPTDSTKSRPTGSQEWGNWRIQVPDTTSEVQFRAYHDCHSIWSTKTVLGTINLYGKLNGARQ